MTVDQMMPTAASPFAVRRFEAKDRSGVMALYAEFARGEVASEMADLASASVEGAAADHQVWVAEAAGRIIGSAAVVHHDVRVAHAKYLTVATDHFDYDVVARALAELAVKDAWERGYLKLIVHTETPANQISPNLRSMGFEFSREHDVNGEHVLEFYQNLYQTPGLLNRQAGQSEIAP